MSINGSMDVQGGALLKPSKRQRRFDQFLAKKWMQGIERKHPEVAQKLKEFSTTLKSQQQDKETKQA